MVNGERPLANQEDTILLLFQKWRSRDALSEYQAANHTEPFHQMGAIFVKDFLISQSIFSQNGEEILLDNNLALASEEPMPGLRQAQPTSISLFTTFLSLALLAQNSMKRKIDAMVFSFSSPFLLGR